ncbi:MAG: hypothetical protein FK733_03695 [Asgard group archaeon]|nr:hypothetical protein [Asgard group archaeon]
MSSDDDIFLKTFKQMIDALNGIQTTLDLLKKSIDVIQLSIDGLGTGLTDINTNILELNNKFASFSDSLSKATPQPVQQPVVKTKQKATSKKKESKEESKTEPQQVVPLTAAQHPIFIDLLNKLNEVGTFKEVGELLIESLDQIESTFSFSRVFYEIRRIGNSLIRKGTSDFPPQDKLELNEKLLDWETRLSE